MRWRYLLIVLLLASSCFSGQRSGPAQPSSTMLRADNAYQRGEYAEAAILYRSVLSGDVSDDEYVQVSYRLAGAYYRLGRYDEAADVIEELRTRYPEGQWATVWTLYGDVEQARGHNVSAILWFERAYLVADENDRGKLSARIASVADAMTDDERRQARPLVSSELVRRALDAPRRALTALPTPSVLAATPTITPTAGPESARIGLLLPLTGKYRGVGAASLDGARAAASNDADLVPADTRGTAAGGVNEYAMLRADASIIAVVGPLRADEAAAVAPRAARGDLAVLLLAQGEGLGGPPMLQIGMTRSLQAQTLAAYSVRKLGLRNFAVVHPGDAFGSSFTSAFRSAVRAEGAQVLGAVPYTPGEVDFGSTVEQLQALHGRTPLEAIFVPDSAATVALLAPEIRRALPQTQLLGSSDWNEGSILAGVARSLDGAIFVDGFFADSGRPATQEFVTQFRRRFGRRPGLLEAQAHDAVALVEAAISRGSFSRQEIDLMLRDFGAFQGAAGAMEIAGGVVRKQLFLLRFRNGAVEELTW